MKLSKHIQEADKDAKSSSANDQPTDGQDEKASNQPTSSNSADLTVSFNASRVRRYNKAEFTSNTGTVKKITKAGLIVTAQPDQVDLVVNFDDLIDPQPQPISKAPPNQPEDMSEGVAHLAKKFFKYRT